MILRDVTILVVDDDPALRDVFCEIFEFEGAIVHQAGSGNDALAWLQTHSADVVFTDYKMADGNGADLLIGIKHMLNAHSTMPVCFVCTGYSDMNADELKALGAVEVFFKPFGMDSEVERIRAALDQVRAT